MKDKETFVKKSAFPKLPPTFLKPLVISLKWAHVNTTEEIII